MIINRHVGKTFLVGFILYEFDRNYLKRTRDWSVSNWIVFLEWCKLCSNTFPLNVRDAFTKNVRTDGTTSWITRRVTFT